MVSHGGHRRAARGCGPASLPGSLLADWDFAADIGSTVITDRSPNRLHGVAINMPTRGVTDHTWDGSGDSFLAKPVHYGAIAFHEDDLEDCRGNPTSRSRCLMTPRPACMRRGWTQRVDTRKSRFTCVAVPAAEPAPILYPRSDEHLPGVRQFPPEYRT